MNTVIGTDIKKAVELLNKGEVVAIPTETVYGLAANALSEDAVLRIYEVKQRPRFNPLILHVASLEHAREYVNNLPVEAQQLTTAFWPGSLTLLLDKKETVPDLVTAGSNRVALRVPNHPLTLQLLQQLSFPLAAPSANPSGYVSPTSAQHVYDNLHGKIPYILDGGECGVGVESTILGWNKQQQPEVYRLGGIPVEAIEEVLQQKLRIKKSITENPDAPGQLKSHYATTTPLHLHAADDLPVAFSNKKVIRINFKNYHPSLPKEQQLILSENGSLEEAAKHLFKTLRAADAMQADVLIAERLPGEGLGAAINDRLERAQFIMK
ncbi:L-threonylcarbamoyladenylate synthase [Lacibacter sp. MH-610]|uniref:L-threonylcarbamoyladenylate synthase n=1 Tax=Lacibacter sp. MH-610 TaxID=3020883 RepID=UPI003891E936